jgi:uncharacterized protein YciI
MMVVDLTEQDDHFPFGNQFSPTSASSEMTRFAAYTLSVAVLVLAMSPRVRAQELPPPREWQTHFAWFLLTNPDYAPESRSADSTLTVAHIQYQLRLHSEGKSIAAGGFAPRPGDPIIGLTILRAETLAEAQALAAADPAVRAGRLLATVREWWVPAEQLP